MAHHTDEVWSDVQTQGVDEDREAEGLCKTHHLFVGSEVEAARHDAHEEHERHAERDAANAQLAQRHAHADNQRQHHQRLYCRVYGEKTVNPFHCIFMSFVLEFISYLQWVPLGGALVSSAPT